MHPEPTAALIERILGHVTRNVHRNDSLPRNGLFPDIVMCPVCATPIKARYDTCIHCREAKNGPFVDQLADFVVPLSYAIKGFEGLQQAYYDMFRYKCPPTSRDSVTRVTQLLKSFSTFHLACLEARTRIPVSFVSYVPSGRSPDQETPLARISRTLTTGTWVAARHVGTRRGPRSEDRATTIDPDLVEFDHKFSGHTVIVEDSWVTGRNAQSAAISAHQNGAQFVTIVAIARVLDYSWEVSERLVNSWPRDTTWRVTACPVSGLDHQVPIDPGKRLMP